MKEYLNDELSLIFLWNFNLNRLNFKLDKREQKLVNLPSTTASVKGTITRVMTTASAFVTAIFRMEWSTTSRWSTVTAGTRASCREFYSTAPTTHSPFQERMMEEWNLVYSWKLQLWNIQYLPSRPLTASSASLASSNSMKANPGGFLATQTLRSLP